MATTTVLAIRTALEAVLEGLIPTGTAYGRDAFTRQSEYDQEEELAGADVDREFSFKTIKPGFPDEFGVSNELLLNTVLTVLVGHVQAADIDESEARRDDDLMQITDALIDKANYPSGVFLIMIESTDYNEYDATGENFWLSELTFTLKYARTT